MSTNSINKAQPRYYINSPLWSHCSSWASATGPPWNLLNLLKVQDGLWWVGPSGLTRTTFSRFARTMWSLGCREVKSWSWLSTWFAWESPRRSLKHISGCVCEGQRGWTKRAGAQWWFIYSHDKDVNRELWLGSGAFASYVRGPNCRALGMVKERRKIRMDYWEVAEWRKLGPS